MDRRDYNELINDLHAKLNTSPISNRLICIPVEEIEAWFLSDPEGIQKTFKFKNKPKIKGNPETIISPKEKLGDIIYRFSDKNIYYLNTSHNEILASKVSINLMNKKCKSFNLFYAFLMEQKY